GVPPGVSGSVPAYGRHRDPHAPLGGDVGRSRVAGVDVADHARRRVVGQQPLELAGGQLGAVGHTDRPAVARPADPPPPPGAARRGPSAIPTWPAGIGRPMPTPPPWWIEAQVAPELVAVRALSSGQSAIASEPSSMDSVSRYGEATEPESRWSRPMAIGAFTIPSRTRSLKSIPARWRSPEPSQQMRAGRPSNATCSPAASSQRWRGSWSGNSNFGARVVVGMSWGSQRGATQRRGPVPQQNRGGIEAGTKPANSKARS